MERKGSFAPAVVVGTLVLLSSLLSASAALAHGWITSPPSRQDHCAKGRVSFDCQGVQYEPQSVEAGKGSMLCSGGGRFPVLDDDSLPWPVTTVGATTTFNWTCTACHVTLNWEYFVDGRLLATVDGHMAQPASQFSHTVGNLPSGRHKILARWNIGDTTAAFYSCVDVNVGGSSTPTPTQARPRATATATTAARATATARARATATATASARATPTSVGSFPAWQANHAYAVGNNVSYQGLNYRCLQSHTSQVGWEPPNVPALWQRI